MWAGGMNPAVGDQALQRDAGDFPPHRIKAGQGNGLRRIVNDEIDAGQRLDGADVAAFTADDPALHFIVGQRHHRHGGFGHLVGSTALDRVGNQVARLLIGFILKLRLKLRDFQRLLVRQFLFQIGQ